MRKARPVYGGLYNACEKAVKLAAGGTVDRAQARKFFESNFKPVRILPELHTYGYYTGADGFYTGYYEAEVTGSRVKTEEYNVPLYGVPAKVAGKKSTVFAQYDRTEIEKGALAGKGLEICWIKNPVDAFFAQIQGSTRVKLDDGELLRLNYIASNGKPYTPVGRLLIDQGVYTPEEMSMDKIREYMEANPDEGKELREKNRSFVFFSETQLGPHDECLGAQGIPLTPWRSIAVDPNDPRLRHADLDRRQIPAHQRCAAGHVPAFDGGAGHRLRHSRAGARRHLFRPRRGHSAHCRAHQAVRQIRHAGAEGRVGDRHRAGGERCAVAAAAAEGHCRGECAADGAKPKP